jgi:hypothetical protein
LHMLKKRATLASKGFLKNYFRLWAVLIPFLTTPFLLLSVTSFLLQFNYRHRLAYGDFPGNYIPDCMSALYNTGVKMTGKRVKTGKRLRWRITLQKWDGTGTAERVNW